MESLLITISTCNSCQHFDKELWNEMGGDGDIPFCGWRIIECTPDFGCIHWEEKAKNDK